MTSASMGQNSGTVITKKRPVHRRSRHGCRNCKRLKIKCDEAKPTCKACQKNGAHCDYTLVLTWGRQSANGSSAAAATANAAKLPAERRSSGVEMKFTSFYPSSPSSSSSSHPTANPGTILSEAPSSLHPTAVQETSAAPVSPDLGGKTLTNQEVLRKISTTFQDLFTPSPQQRPTDQQSFVYEYSSGPRQNSKRIQNQDLRENQTQTNPGFSNLVSDQDLNVHNSVVGILPYEQVHIVPFTVTQDHAPSIQQQTTASIPSESAEFTFDPPFNSSSNQVSTPIYDVIARFDEYDFLQPREFIDDFIITEQAYNSHHSYKMALMQNPLRNALSQTRGYGNMATSPHSSSSDTSDGEFYPDRTIPRAPLALPDLLIQVPAYRELYHHFLSVTADSLVPVPRIYYNNPFRTILPRMAMNTPHLLSIIVAYAATHRARCLNIPEPVEVINRLLSRTIDNLTAVLENETEAQSDTTLATAMMLCSYSIITTANEESWRTHLHGAREIVLARGIANSLSGGLLENSAEVSIEGQQQTNEETSSSLSTHYDSDPPFGPQPLRMFNKRMSASSELSFLLRVFAYIDVIGALSSSDASSFLTPSAQASQLWTIPSWNHSYNGSIVHDNPNVDFLLGLDLTMIPVLSKVSSLARRRRELDLYPENIGSPEYITQDESIVAEAVELSKVLFSCCESGERRRKNHIRSQFHAGPESKYMLQLAAMNLMFGYAGLIHLYRRVLRMPTQATAVQELVATITRVLDENIPLGNSIEACISFPIFSAACEVIDTKDRLKYRQRMACMQRFGFAHVARAQEVIEECWRTNVPWTDIVEEKGWSLVLA